MSELHRNQVLKYLKDFRMESPLVFVDYKGDEAEFVNNPLDNLSVLSMAEKVMDISRDYRSHLFFDGKISTYETPSGAWRSIGDLWRHIIYFKPDVSIFDVMEAVGKDYDYFVGHICCTIGRRVFYPGYLEDGDNTVINTFDTDEFGLTLYEWSSIKS